MDSAGGSQGGRVQGAFNPPETPRGQEGPGLQSIRVSKVAAQRGWLPWPDVTQDTRA